MAAGMALANKLQNNGSIGIVFIGDGTLGEGVLYETMNIISLWNLPLLIVCLSTTARLGPGVIAPRQQIATSESQETSVI